MARSRTTHTAEFKLAAVERITDRDFSVAAVARRLAVREPLLRDWRKAVLARGDAAFPGHGHRPRTNSADCGSKWSASRPSGTC